MVELNMQKRTHGDKNTKFQLLRCMTPVMKPTLSSRGNLYDYCCRGLHSHTVCSKQNPRCQHIFYSNSARD
ncbi:hypothetical protein SUGI_0998270 [Cryptomeria japonica]|nr:hypothetical protein SUGI_0998270 [Cryptomeria japonica]